MGGGGLVSEFMWGIVEWSKNPQQPTMIHNKPQQINTCNKDPRNNAKKTEKKSTAHHTKQYESLPCLGQVS